MSATRRFALKRRPFACETPTVGTNLSAAILATGLALCALSACGPPGDADLVGTWCASDSSTCLDLDADGTFAAVDFPADVLVGSDSPNRNVSGAGTWGASVRGNGAIDIEVAASPEQGYADFSNTFVLRRAGTSWAITDGGDVRLVLRRS
jgi:hypothetical protein